MTKITGVLLLIFATASWAVSPPRFPDTAVWYQDISAATVHPDSAAMIAQLQDLGGFGAGSMRTEFNFHIVHAPQGAPTRTIDWPPGEYFLPDCEPLGTSLPVPANSAVEALPDLDCDGGDCHLLVVQDDLLYEAYQANGAANDVLETQCLVIWELNRVYPPEGRGEHCISADISGLPIAPLLFNADEIAASLSLDDTGGGNLGHAIRFRLPNDHTASDVNLGGINGSLYVRPASRAGIPSGPKESVAFGSRLRLHDDFDTTGFNPAEKVILNTFKTYGIVLADSGQVALTAESDLYTTTKWSDLEVGQLSFSSVLVTDFDVIDTGARIAETYSCDRTIFPDELLFENGFETD